MLDVGFDFASFCKTWNLGGSGVLQGLGEWIPGQCPMDHTNYDLKHVHFRKEN